MSEEQHLGDRDPVEMEVQSVPDSWDLIDFESAFELVSANDRKVPSSEYLPEGPLPVVDQGQQFIGGFTNKVDLAIEPGDGLLVFGDHTRIFKPIDFPFAAGADGIKILRPRVASMKYCFYACSSLQFPNKGYARHYSHLRRCKLPVAPQQEQTRIVSKIDELFSQIENGERALDRVRKLVERYRQSVLKAAVTGELTREWREQHAGELESGEALLAHILEARRKAWETAELAKMTGKRKRPTDDYWKKKYKGPVYPSLNLEGNLPDSWCKLSFEQATSAQRPIAYGVLQPGETREDGVPLVRVCDISDRVAQLSSLKRIAKRVDAQFPRTKLFGGEVLLTIVGTIGRTAIVPPWLSGGNVARAVAVITPTSGVASEWLQIVLRFSKTRQLLTDNAREVARKTLNLEQLREFGVPVPPIDEQRAAISFIDEFLSKEHSVVLAINQQAKLLSGLRQAILHSAFSGKLVPQDPSDEPASVLLERIAAERAPSVRLPAAKRARKKRARA